MKKIETSGKVTKTASSDEMTGILIYRGEINSLFRSSHGYELD